MTGGAGSSSSSPSSSTPGHYVGALVLKAIFVTCLILQVVLWPSAVTICFACVYAMSELFTMWRVGTSGVLEALLKPGPCILVGGPESRAYTYAFMSVMAFYFGSYFGLFVGHELDLQPAQTVWLPSSIVGNYSMSPTHNTPFPVDVTSTASSQMRDNTFVWGKHWQGQAPVLTGTIAGAGPGGSVLTCPAALAASVSLRAISGGGQYSGGSTNSSPSAGTSSVSQTPSPSSSTSAAFGCFIKLMQVQPPQQPSYQNHPFVPIAEPFYHTDVRVTPPAGTQCKDLEVYRIILDKDKNVVHGLDYPSSIVGRNSGGGAASSATCGIFNTATWCLQLSHPFTDAQYRQEVSKRCDKNNGVLVFKLPNRAPDIDYEEGKVSADILLATAGASVQLHAGWQHIDRSYYGWFWSPWKQVAYGDSAQRWRESSSDGDVFFKFVVSITPLLIVWYYLTVGFEDVIGAQAQVLLLCVFVLMPAVGLFLSIGAWVPMGGCLICVLAVNRDRSKDLYTRIIVPTLLFITAICNSIQVAWLSAILGQAGYSALYYEITLQQLYTLSDRFIISDGASPTWTSLVMPCILILNIALLLGAAICIVLETLLGHRPKSAAR